MDVIGLELTSETLGIFDVNSKATPNPTLRTRSADKRLGGLVAA